MNKIIGVLGLGRFGSTIAKTLSEYDCDVIAVDCNEENVSRVEPYVAKGVVGDITDLSLLQAIGLEECDAVVIATGSTLEASVLALMNCKKLHVPHILAKARNRVAREVLEEMGADQVILPEKETGIRIAKTLMRTHIEDIVDLDEEISVVEFSPPRGWVGKSIQELDLRNRYDINIIGMREKRGARLNVGVTGDTVLEKNLILVGITESEIFERHDFLDELE